MTNGILSNTRNWGRHLSPELRKAIDALDPLAFRFGVNIDSRPYWLVLHPENHSWGFGDDMQAAIKNWQRNNIRRRRIEDQHATLPAGVRFDAYKMPANPNANYSVLDLITFKAAHPQGEVAQHELPNGLQFEVCMYELPDQLPETAAK